MQFFIQWSLKCRKIIHFAVDANVSDTLMFSHSQYTQNCDCCVDHFDSMKTSKGSLKKLSPVINSDSVHSRLY